MHAKAKPLIAWLLVALVLATICDALVGPVPLKDLFRLLSTYFNEWGGSHSGSDPNQALLSAVFELRIPRVFVAMLCGASLAAAGCLTQGLFRNVLASPSILGIETGSTLFATLAIYFGSSGVTWLSTPAAALFGAVFTLSIVLGFAAWRPGWGSDDLLLVGFALNSVQVAITSFISIMALEEHQYAGAVAQWLLGSFSSRTWEHVAIAATLFLAGLLTSWHRLRRYDVLSLGEDVGASLGLNIVKLRRQTVLSVGLFVGAAVAVAGAIPFVSLLVPHVARQLIGPRHRSLLIVSCLLGAILMMGADVIARTVRAPNEIEVGVLTTLLGAPFFLLLLLQRRRIV